MEAAKQMDRTLILPPFNEFHAPGPGGQAPAFPAFAEVFSVERVQKYHSKRGL